MMKRHGLRKLREVDPREFRDFEVQFGEVVRSLPFQLPENFLLIIRAMSLTSGVCSALDPEFNVWDSVKPYAAQLLRDERGNLVQDLAQQAVEVAGLAWRLSKRLDALLTRIEDGSLAVTNARLEQRVSRLERTVRRLMSAIVFGGLLIAGVMLRADDAVLGTLLMAASVVSLLYTLFAGRRGR
ncbi:MAG: transporter [Microbacteriaceae bacterium]|nr:transporter [Microbacteriaceae bacterium]